MTSIQDHYQFAVVGNGLIGSAAGRYLSEWSDSVVVIGPGEPCTNNNGDAADGANDEKQKKTVFSSHYDQGRLCRAVSEDPIWHVINGQAVAKYNSLEERSGIRFYDPVGRVKVGRQRTASEQEEILGWMKRTQQQHPKIEFQYFPAGDQSWKETLFTMLDFPLECDLCAESAPSGIINPRQLIAAQNAIAQKEGGATILFQLVVKVEAASSANDVVKIHLANGKCLSADQVLIACGAFTNFNNLLPQPIPLLYKTETTVWATVSEETAHALQGMPAVSYDPPQRTKGQTEENAAQPAIDDLYMAPPLLYPDDNGGTYKIKMGCNTIHEQWPTTLPEIQEWFRAGNSDVALPAMVDALQSQLPGVPFVDFTSHSCIVTYTPSGYPTVDAVPGQEDDSSPGQRRLFVAAGGNGTSAQGSDTLGHLAARLMYDGRWILDDFGIPRDVFCVANQWGQSGKKLSKAQKRAMFLAAGN